MGTIIIAMPKEEDSDHLAEMIRKRGLLYDIEICCTASEVLLISNERDFGLVICAGKVRDMNYVELSGYLQEFFGMIVLTRDMTVEISSSNMMKLNLPLKIRELVSTIDTMAGFLEQRIRRKKPTPRKRSAKDQKIIDDAKALLMERNGMTEPEAFRYIQKSSMDTGRSLIESAQMVILLSE